MVDFQSRDTRRGLDDGDDEDEEEEEDEPRSEAQDAPAEQEDENGSTPDGSATGASRGEGDPLDADHGESGDDHTRETVVEDVREAVADDRESGSDHDRESGGHHADADGPPHSHDGADGQDHDPHADADEHDHSHDDHADADEHDHSHDDHADADDHDHSHDDHDGHDHHHDHDEHDHHHHDVDLVGVAVVTVSSTRSLEDDPSGDIVEAVVEGGDHEVVSRDLIRDDFDGVQSTVSVLTDRDDVDAVVLTGGTGVTPDDVTVEAVEALYDKALPGFGELFRSLSYDQIGTRVVATRASAGVVDGVPVFCLPGSENAAHLGTEQIILPEMGHLAGLASRES